MDLRSRNKLRSRLNSEEWITKNSGKQKCLKKNQISYLPAKKICLDKVDKFCWVCHTLSTQGKFCSQCPRVYHVKCIKSSTFDGEGACPECQHESLTDDEEPFSCNRSLNELLMYSIDRILEKKQQLKEMFYKWPEHTDNFKLYKIVDIDYFCQKLLSGSYKKPVEFLSDFKWLYHNCSILYGEKSKYVLGAEQLVKKLQEELTSLEVCAECYFYQNSNAIDEEAFFSLTCSKQHEVIFAKVKGYTFWPAKCLKKTKNGSAHVVFFGTHEVACVPATMWFSVTEQPASSQSLQQRGHYYTAIKELFTYKDNLSKHQIPTSKIKKNSPVVKKASIGTQTSVETQTAAETQTSETKNILSERNELESGPGSFSANPSGSEIASITMTFCQETVESTDDDMREMLFISKSSRTDDPGSDNKDIQEIPIVPSTSSNQYDNNTKYAKTSMPNVQSNTTLLDIDKQFVHSEAQSKSHNSCIPNCQISNNLMNNEPSLTANLAKLFFDMDPQFSSLFQQKSKDLVDSMMVHVWTKLNTLASTGLMDEAGILQLVDKERQKLRILEENEKLQMQLNGSNHLIKSLSQECQIQCENIEKKEKLLSEMETRLALVKIEKTEVTEKYHNLQNELFQPNN